ALISASVIPLSMLIAISLLNQFGVLGNLMSLGAIDFGMLVDSAIIVVEAVVLEMTLVLKEYGSSNLDYFEREEAVTNASLKVKKSVVFGGLIILIVYIPIMSLTGIEGKMFSPMAITVAFAIFGALLLSLTYIPVMCVWFIRPHNHHDLLTKFADNFVGLLFRAYEPLLNVSLRNKWTVVAISVLFMGIGVFCFSNIGGEFIPKIDEGDYNIEARLPVGTSLSQTIKISNKISTKLLENYPNEIKNVVCKIGTSEIPTDPASFEVMDIIINPHPKDKWKRIKHKEELTENIATFLDQFPGLTYSIMQPIENRFNDMLSGAKTDLVIKIFGDDLDILVAKGNEIANILRTVEGAKDIQVQKLGGLPQISINYDRKRLQHYGISVGKINDVLQSAFAGKKAGTIYEGERRYDLSVRLAPQYRSNLSQIRNLHIEDKNGNFIPLKEIAEINIDKGPAEISRENGERRINVGANVRGRDIESLVNELNEKVKSKVKLPKGYTIDYGGQFENLNRAKARLSIVVPLALLVIFALLYATFNSYKESLIIFSAVPLAAVGGIFSLMLRDMVFSISAGVGFIALFGVSVLNGIILIGEFKALEEKGIFNIYHKVKMGIKEKFRPILLTSMVAAFGFLPMAMSHGAGSEVQKPLATVVVGGLLSATLLTLVVLPIIYVLANNKKTEKFELDV
ncbi:MAG: efflux RND transporter permease subunit, partial [Cytophagales bacterium]